jgi:hypothetical protein
MRADPCGGASSGQHFYESVNPVGEVRVNLNQAHIRTSSRLSKLPTVKSSMI